MFALGFTLGVLITLLVAIYYGQVLVDRQEKQDKELFEKYTDDLFKSQTTQEHKRYEG